LPDRLDVLVRRQRRTAEDPHSEVASRLRRRHALDIAAPGPGVPALAALARRRATRLHTEKHQQELQRQAGLRMNRHLDAAVDGTLGATGGTGLTDDAVRKHREERARRNKNFWTQRQNNPTAAQRLRVVRVRPGTSVFVADSAWEPALGIALGARKCRRVDDRVLADIFVARDPATPCGKTEFCAAAKGSWVVSPAFWHSPPGTAVQYQRALNFTRRIFVSASCRAAHPDVTAALRRLIELGRCSNAVTSWRLEGDWDTFLRRASGRSTAAGRKEYVALLLPFEMEAEPYRALPPVCRKTFSTFAREIIKLRTSQSRGLRLAGAIIQ
jgi:hypothetical protein